MADTTKVDKADKSDKTDARRQIASKIKESNNILVALNDDPSVDELSAALGLTLLINKIGKHATAVFSGEIPDTLHFLEPDKTFESNVNSLRDFIIALNKEKADHLHYKVDDEYVRIFVTPYRTTISEEDLEFSQGDFNIDLVVALNVKSEESLDGALSAHGRILHDATVVSISTMNHGGLGDTRWTGNNPSSISEMIVSLSGLLNDPETKESVVDKSIATALLTGIVSATNRFANNKTTPNTLSVASKLMSYGADQQLIATNLEITSKTTPKAEEPQPEPEVPEEPAKSKKGVLSVDHKELKDKVDKAGEAATKAMREKAARVAEQKLKQIKSQKETDKPESTPTKVPTIDEILSKSKEPASASVPDMPPEGTSEVPVAPVTDAPPASVQDLAPPVPAPAMQGAVSGDIWLSDNSSQAPEPKPTVAGKHAYVAPPKDEQEGDIKFKSEDISTADPFNESKLMSSTNSGINFTETPSPLSPSSVPQTPAVDPILAPAPPPPIPDFPNVSGLPLPPIGASLPTVDTSLVNNAPIIPEASPTPPTTLAQPVMQDQVYPAPKKSDDPAQFKIPGM